jgi:DNA-binding NarL/FixJ family response regulator
MPAMTDGSSTPRIKLVLVDDHPVVLQGLQQFLERHDDCDVVACCASADAGFFAVQRHHPDVLVLDLRMPGRDGLSLLRSLSASDIPCRTVLLTAANNGSIAAWSPVR